MMKRVLLLCLLPLFAFAGSKDRFQGFVKIAADRELYVDWIQAKQGQPTVVLVNGLTYSTRDWDPFTEALAEMGVGVVRFDPMGMGQTLLKYAPVTNVITIESQVADLQKLLAKLKVPKPYNMAGLSYGGGFILLYAATYPSEVKNIIAMAPYTQPVAMQDQWIQSQIWYTRRVMPWNKATDDELYAYFFRQIVYSTYPSAEPTILENPFKMEAVVNMGLGIRKLSGVKIAPKLPASTIHLMIAGKDQYIPRGIMEEFWDAVPVSARASHIVLNNSEHKIPEAVPNFSAALVREIIVNRSVFSEGRKFEADPYTGRVSYKNGRIELPKEF